MNQTYKNDFLRRCFICIYQAHFFRHTPQKKRRCYGVFQMDLAGVEPASESPSIEASPITVIILTFPLPAA